MVRNIKRLWKVLRFVFAAIPLLIGLFGYYVVGGVEFFDALYAAAALYFINPVEDVTNVYIVIAEIGALLVAVGVLAKTVSTIYSILKKAPLHIRGDYTAIYTDNEQGETLANNWEKSVLVHKENGALNFKNQVVMFKNDLDNLTFVSENINKFKRKGVKLYLLLNELDSTILKEDKNLDINFFNINDLVARSFWKTKDLTVRSHWDIAIIGYGKVGKAIFKYAYLNELFSLDQTITYHIYGASEEDKSILRNLEFMNNDRVIAHDEMYEDSYQKLVNMDMVILSDSDNTIQTVQGLLRYNPMLDVSFYSDTQSILADIINAPSVCSFGQIEEVLTENEIRRGYAYRQGMLFNYDYNHREDKLEELPENIDELIEAEWKTLNGFFKGANLAKADQYRIKKQLIEAGTVSNEELAEIEHIRWSRYYYYNGWSYASKRDNAKKKHNMLIPFSELPKTETSKDEIQNPAIEREINRLIENMK